MVYAGFSNCGSAAAAAKIQLSVIKKNRSVFAPEGLGDKLFEHLKIFAGGEDAFIADFDILLALLISNAQFRLP